MSKQVLLREHQTEVDAIDDGVTNKWRWGWMEKVVSIDMKKSFPNIKWNSEDPLSICLKDCIRKINEPGKAICLLCQKSDNDLKYSTNGVSALTKHVLSRTHVVKEVLKTQNFTLPGSGPVQNIVENYGAPPQYYDVPAASTTEAPQPTVHIADRVANMEAMVTAFLAEKSLSFPMAQAIIDLSKELSKDPQALRRLTLFRTTASYKLVHGTAKTMHDDLIKKLKATPFSLNMDEATASNNMRVCTVLVCYHEEGQIKTEHLDSFDAPVVDSETLFNEMKKMFERLQLPWENLLAILMDSASVMRGSKSGLEKRIRDSVAPHLLDIDGDSCHHVHNIVKKFVKPFDYFLENLFRDIHRDFNLSPDLLKRLKTICYHMHLTFRVPPNYICTRWLSVLDVCIDFSYMRDAYMVFYYPFVADSSQKSKAMEKIFEKYSVSKHSQVEIRKVQKILAGKKFTKKGKARKVRIVDALLNKDKVTLVTSLYESVLPLFKEFIMAFQKSSPKIHKLYYKQVDLFKQFLSYFMKPGVIANCATGKSLLKVPFTADTLLRKTQVFTGIKAKEVVKSAKANDATVDWFFESAAKTYRVCGEYAKEKLPLRNKALKSFAAIAPDMVLSQKECVMHYLLELPDLLFHVFTVDEKEMYEVEVRKLMHDGTLPSSTDEKGEEIEIVQWWTSLVKKYPLTHKMIMSILSVFHGPKVESSFSIMGDVIDKKANKMKDKTFSSIQTVKYCLQAKHPAPCSSRAVKVFSRADKHYTPVSSALVTNMRNARAKQMSAQRIEKEKRDQEDEMYGKTADESMMKTRKSLVSENAELVAKSRANHKRILEKAYKPKPVQGEKKRKSTSKDGDEPSLKAQKQTNEADNGDGMQLEEVVEEPADVNVVPTGDLKQKKRKLQQVSLAHCIKKKK